MYTNCIHELVQRDKQLVCYILVHDKLDSSMTATGTVCITFTHLTTPDPLLSFRAVSQAERYVDVDSEGQTLFQQP